MGFATSPATLANLSHLTPRPVKGLFGDNYLSVGDMDFTQQFLPEVYEKEVERYGNRTIAGFLRMVGAEMPMASDQVVWSEQGRLHISFDDIVKTDGSTITFASADDAKLVGIGATVVLSKGYNTVKAYVSAKPSTTTATVLAYGAANIDALGSDGATAVKLFVYGSEYAKGSSNAGNSIDASSGVACSSVGCSAVSCCSTSGSG